MSKFKVGDRVKVIATKKEMYKGFSYAGGKEKGDICIVTDTDISRCKLDGEGWGGVGLMMIA
jgi:hypothetical protein